MRRWYKQKEKGYVAQNKLKDDRRRKKGKKTGRDRKAELKIIYLIYIIYLERYSF